MICKKCGKTILDGSTFCAHCGFDLRDSVPSNQSCNTEDQIPLLLLARQIVKHKVATIISVIVVALTIGGYIAFKKHVEKKKVESEIVAMIEHYAGILGFYKISSSYNPIKLYLGGDNKARITINVGKYNERSYLGYWREKAEDYPIEIDFSESFEIYIGNKERSYCRTLYLYDNRLWESLSAIRSLDYGASELLEKE
jgi:hypothetical protein